MFALTRWRLFSSTQNTLRVHSVRRVDDDDFQRDRRRAILLFCVLHLSPKICPNRIGHTHNPIVTEVCDDLKLETTLFGPNMGGSVVWGWNGFEWDVLMVSCPRG
jgi:hypothetical protein